MSRLSPGHARGVGRRILCRPGSGTGPPGFRPLMQEEADPIDVDGMVKSKDPQRHASLKQYVTKQETSFSWLVTKTTMLPNLFENGCSRVKKPIPGPIPRQAHTGTPHDRPHPPLAVPVRSVPPSVYPVARSHRAGTTADPVGKGRGGPAVYRHGDGTGLENLKDYLESETWSWEPALRTVIRRAFEAGIIERGDAWQTTRCTQPHVPYLQPGNLRTGDCRYSRQLPGGVRGVVHLLLERRIAAP